MLPYLLPLFKQPFVLPAFPAQPLWHRAIVHFPVAFALWGWALELADLVTGSRHSHRRAYRRLFYLASLFIPLTYLTGQLSSMREGIRLSDPAWVEGNLELATSLINHRGMAALTAMAFVTAALLKYFLFTDAFVARPAAKRLELAVTTLAILMIALTAHLGGSLSL